MAAVLVYNCPHCGATQMTFTCHGSDLASADGGRSYHWNTLFTCRKCREGIVAKFAANSHADPSNCGGDPRDDGYQLMAVYPSPTRLEAPDHVPPDLTKDYIEGLDSLRSVKLTSAGMMFRRVLDIATKRLAPEQNDGTLYNRILYLEKTGKITPELRGLADRIRLDGNEAVHEENFDETKVAQLKEFTHLFLLYTFTLPQLVAQAKGEDP